MAGVARPTELRPPHNRMLVAAGGLLLDGGSEADGTKVLSRTTTSKLSSGLMAPTNTVVGLAGAYVA